MNTKTARKSVTLNCNPDVSLIGENATSDELDTYHANLATLIATEFDVEVLQVRGSGRDCCPESEDITARIREIESSDEWTQLL